MTLVKRFLLWGESLVVFALLLLFLLSFNNPFFIDSISSLIIYFLVLPFVVGAILGILSYPLGRFLSGAKGASRVEAAQVSSVNGFLFVIYLLYLFFLFIWNVALPLKLIAAVVGAAVLWLLSRLLRPLVSSLSRSSAGRLIRPIVYAVLILLLVVGTLGRRAYFDHQRLISAGDEQKLFLIGFDGATWKIIKPMMERGELPHHEFLVQTGSFGNLESLEPMFSPQIWGSIASGKTPEKHGIFDFLATTEDVLVKRIWDIFNERGHTIGVFSYFTTSPPYPVNGFMIPGLQASGSETYPEKYSFYRKLRLELSGLRGQGPGGLVPLWIPARRVVKKASTMPAEESGLETQQRIPLQESIPYFLQCIRYGLRLSTLDYMLNILLNQLSVGNQFTKHKTTALIKLAKLRISSDIFAYLTARDMPDLAIFYSKIIDSNSHHYWKFMEPQKFPGVSQDAVEQLRDMIAESYREADFALGKFLHNRTRNQTVIICSDHGFKAADTKVYSLRGYTLLEAMGLQDSARIWSVMDESYLVVDDPEWAESLVKRLRGLTFGEERLSFLEVKTMLDNPDHYRLIVNPQLQRSPGDKQLHLAERSLPASQFLRKTSQVISGVHARDGILLINGPEIKRDFEVSGASVLDVTPTILALYHYPIAEDFDGKVLKDVFPDDYFAKAELEFIDSYEDEATPVVKRKPKVKQLTEDMIERLKALGYLR